MVNWYVIINRIYITDANIVLTAKLQNCFYYSLLTLYLY